MAESTIDNHVLPKGFICSGASAGIAAKKTDLAAIVSEKDCVVSGVFTTNRLKAESLNYSMPLVHRGSARAILVNAGIANTCTGQQGFEDSKAAARALASAISSSPDKVLFFSTGMIGKPLPIQRIVSEVPGLVKGLSNDLLSAAEAIMTTDIRPKLTSEELVLSGNKASIAGIAKGAGMISPKLATMLCFIFTDARISRPALDAALKSAVKLTFNRITVDGDTSPNDTVVVMANGLAGNPEIKDTSSSDYKAFLSALSSVCENLSRKIIEDGEGATKFISITVSGAPSEKVAEQVAFSVADSKLVKTALYASNPNVGRIITAVGYAKIDQEFDFSKLGMKVNGEQLYSNGKIDFTRARALDLKPRFIEIELALGSGSYQATVFTTDLSEEYVRINADYN